jgi:ribosomal protein L30/L7E
MNQELKENSITSDCMLYYAVVLKKSIISAPRTVKENLKMIHINKINDGNLFRSTPQSKGIMNKVSNYVVFSLADTKRWSELGVKVNENEYTLYKIENKLVNSANVKKGFLDAEKWVTTFGPLKVK